ncbi:MAG: hypothetical protein WC548_01505 [Candidatus Pacearchaeota archaeon]
MVEKYKLQYWDNKNTVLSISWASDREDYVTGDCRVRAIRESTDVYEHNRGHSQVQNYTEPMTLDESRTYIAKNSKMLGSQIHDCVGLTLEDVCENVEFGEPIQVRNY